MEFLSTNEHVQLADVDDTHDHTEAVLEQLNRILSSQAFRRVHEEARKFLPFVVGKTLLGKADEVKEMTIGMQIWKDDAFDPLTSSRVRTAASALRKRLAEYYRTEGRFDPIEIAFTGHGYVPEIKDRRLSIDVGLFEDLNLSEDHRHLCAFVTDELVYRLTRAGAIHAKRTEVRASTAQHCVLGSLSCRDDIRVRLNVLLQSRRAGRISWESTFEGPRDDLMKLLLQVAHDVLSFLRPEPTIKVGAKTESGPQR